MIQPNEMKLNFPMKLSNEKVSTTTQVWDILVASKDANLEKVKELVNECPELIYAQYNYTPPIHFAVREGHVDLVNYILDQGALDPKYITYPFKDTLLTVAQDRGYNEIAVLLEEYLKDPSRCRYTGDNGEILYDRTDDQKEFQRAVNNKETEKVKTLLKEHPEFALEELAFWGEGILMMPANMNNIELIELLMAYGARVPDLSKWARFYYFKHYEIAAYLLKHGMNANHMTWHHVTLLHDMAQEGNIRKAELLISHQAEINPIEEEYQSTPLGLAARWGHQDMVEFLLEQRADPNKAGAAWSTPLAWARKKGHKKIEDLLLKAGAE